MTRDQALKISDHLVEAAVSHSIQIGVQDKFLPRERYSVNVTPVLSYSPTDISALQRIADFLGFDIAYIQGTFTFAERG
jgi:hypothetical protein